MVVKLAEFSCNAFEHFTIFKKFNFIVYFQSKIRFVWRSVMALLAGTVHRRLSAVHRALRFLFAHHEGVRPGNSDDVPLCVSYLLWRLATSTVSLFFKFFLQTFKFLFFSYLINQTTGNNHKTTIK